MVGRHSGFAGSSIQGIESCLTRASGQIAISQKLDIKNPSEDLFRELNLSPAELVLAMIAGFGGWCCSVLHFSPSIL